MSSEEERGVYRGRRGEFRPGGVVWEELAKGSTNRLWRGRGRGADWLFKWYRYPQLGVHPEVEVAEYLRGYPGVGVAGFGGKVERRDANGEWMTVGLLQRWVEGRVAWEQVLEGLGKGRGDVEQARGWGRTVGELHQVMGEGLEGSAFCKEEWGAADRVAWAKRVEGIGEALLGALCGKRPEGVDLEVWARARERWVEGEEQWRARAVGLGRLEVSGWKARVHGDLHLGQILEVGGGGSVVVDFEGEPMRPLSERRGKDVALRDVAGMWRSFGYAGVVSGAMEDVVGELQGAFLEGWRERMEVPGGDWQGLLEGLVWEKAIYETLYELRHRPGWLGVPLAAL